MPTARYRDVFNRIRFDIATGATPTGARLPSLRDAAAEYGVHLHTVRRAYQELADVGLIRLDARKRAVVLAKTGTESDVRAFLQEIRTLAQERHGLDLDALVDQLERLRTDGVPAVTVVECSHTLGESLANQLRAAWRIRTAVHRLGDGPVPVGPVVSTYFHYREVTTAMAGRPHECDFVRISVDPQLVESLRAQAELDAITRISILETDAVLGDQLVQVLAPQIGGTVTFDVITSRRRIANTGTLAPHHRMLVSPRRWDMLEADEAARVDAIRIEYTIDARDLIGLGRERGWMPARARTARRSGPAVVPR